jgi:hypothetical protein
MGVSLKFEGKLRSPRGLKSRKVFNLGFSISRGMCTNRLVRKAMELVLKGRATRDLKIKDEVFDGLWELLVNLDYELYRKGRVPISPN